MTLGKKIASGFGALLAITLALGIMALINMKNAELNSMDMVEKYIPEVSISADIERNFAKTRISISKFLFNEHEDDYEQAQEFFDNTQKAIVEAEELVTKYPELVTLKRLIGDVKRSTQAYERGVHEIAKLFEEKDAVREKLDTNARIFMMEARSLRNTQQSKLNSDLRAGLSLAKIEERLEKIYGTQRVITRGYDARVGNFKSAARRDNAILQESFDAFKKLDDIYAKLRTITYQQADLDVINKVEEAGNNYKNALKELDTISAKTAELEGELIRVGTEALLAIEEVSNAGLNGAAKLAHESDKSLEASVSVMTIGLIIAVLVGIALAFFITRGITKAIIAAVQSIQEANNQVVTASNEIADSSSSLAEGASRQASSVEEVSATIEESTSINTQNAQNSKEADILAKETKSAAEQGYEKGNELMSAMQEINHSSEKISKIIKTIDEIASQTKLLALNAAVEAARAGEHGLGFAVVADEVKSLAQRSADAATETANIIEESITQAKNGSAISEQTSEAFNNILERINKTSNLIGEISISAKEQSDGMNQIASAMGEIDQITQQNAATSEEAAAASEELNAQAVSMKETVGIIAKMVGFISDERNDVSRQKTTKKIAHHHEQASPKKKIGHNKKTPTKQNDPNDVFPLEEDDLKEF